MYQLEEPAMESNLEIYLRGYIVRFILIVTSVIMSNALAAIGVSTILARYARRRTSPGDDDNDTGNGACFGLLSPSSSLPSRRFDFRKLRFWNKRQEPHRDDTTIYDEVTPSPNR